VDGRVDGGRDGIVAGQEAGGDRMRCPVCGYDNLIGAETCDNCGSDIWGRDTPEQAVSFQGRLLGEHLDDLGALAPMAVDPSTPVEEAIEKMQQAEVDCVLVVQDDRLVGIFTDRDAVVKAAGKRLDEFQVRDFMTPDPVVLRHDDPVALAIHKMAVGGFRHIPLMRDGRAAGVVTARDVFRHLAEALD
jgi:signal-transduction protein with cAMP-binding, CBS, and nucleotidyltransferase domain